MLHAIKYLLLRAKWTEYACHSFIRMSSLLSIVFIYAPHLFVCSLIFTSLSIFHLGSLGPVRRIWSILWSLSEFELLRIVFTIFCNNGQWIWKFTCKLWKQIRKEQQINKYICMKYMFPCHGMCRYLRTWCRNICYVCDILHNIHTRTLACNPYSHSHTRMHATHTYTFSVRGGGIKCDGQIYNLLVSFCIAFGTLSKNHCILWCVKMLALFMHVSRSVCNRS